jgi:hypothetical protein
MYPRGAYPAAAFQPQGYPHPPQGALPTVRPPYFPDARIRQRLDDETGLRPAPPIITDKDLKGFDEILENDVQAGWAAANSEIDYNAKLVFSDDEDSTPSKEPNYDEQRDRSDNKQKIADWDSRDFDKDDRAKYRAPQHQQWQQHMPSNPRVGNYEYSQHSQHSQQGQTPIPPYQRPQQIHTNYPHSRHTRSEMVADEDELWRQRSRQQSDEMAAAVIRARQRREEDEKKIERSRQAAHEKLKALEEKSGVEKESSDFDERSRHSSESRDEKLSGRDSRDTRSANYANSFAAPKQYPKNVPPRFQKQAELMRQQQTNQTTQSPPYEQRLTHPLSRLSQDNDQRIAVSNSSQLLNKTPLLADSSRSDSQISSGHESYDSERQTPEFDAVSPKDKRQKQSAIDNNWRSTQTQRLQTNECKDFSENSRSNETHDNIDKSNQISQRDVAKRVNEEPTQIVSKTEFSTQKIRLEIKDTKQRDDTIDREIIVEKKSLIERQESSQSSQSDKRSSSSKEERFTKKYERLDWASECDNVSISSYGKRERHRHVPITQKQFESITEPIKKNFTPLKKNSSLTITSTNDTSKDSSVDKPDNLKKSQTPPPTQSDKANPSTNNATDVSKVQTLKEETHVEVGSKKVRDDDRHYDRNYNRDKDRVRQESTKEDKSTRKSNSNRYDSYQNRGRYPGAAYRGHVREYRRTRGSSEKSSYLDSKLSSSPGHSRSKNNKSRRKSNSDESFVSEEQNKKESLKIEDKSIINPISTTNVSKETKTDEDKEKSSTAEPIVSVSSTTLPNQRNDPSRRGRGAVAFKNSTRGLPRTYGPSNYGPPPSRAAFGDGSVKSDVNRNLDQNRNERNYDSRNSYDFHQTRDNYSKSNKEDTHLSSFSNSQTNKISHDNNRNSIAHNRKGNRGSNNSGANSSANNRSEQIPPRFQKRHNNGSQRGGRARNWNERSGSSNANQVESDVTNNEEWETASESSDIAERNDRKSHKKSNYSEPRNDNRNYNRKSEKRNDYSRGQHSSGSQSSNFRGRHRNSGTNSIPTTRGANANNISTNQRRNGTLTNSNITNDNITVCSLSDVTLDNPTAVEDAMIDIKSRAKLSDEYNDEILNNSENEDGFQTVSYKKRNRMNPGNNSKKLKQEVNSHFLNFKNLFLTLKFKIALMMNMN